jgi:glutamate-1-semialdehyde 2,1-aminomutase
VAAGLATLKAIRQPGVFDAIESATVRLASGLRTAAAKAGIPVQVNQVGTLGCLFFTDRSVKNYDDAKTSDTDLYARWFHELLRRGVYVAPSQFEAFFVSAAHTESDIDRTINCAREVQSILA